MLAAAHRLVRPRARGRLVRRLDQRADQRAHMPGSRMDRVAVVEAGGAHLESVRRDELLAQGREQPDKITMGIPRAHAFLQASPRRSRARRIRLRAVSFSGSDGAWRAEVAWGVSPPAKPAMIFSAASPPANSR